MKNQILVGAGALVLVAVPAVIGLWGNGSFAQNVPVRVPSSGQVVTPAPTPSPSVDDHGGDVPRDQRTEPGDDRDVNGGVTTPTAPAPGATATDDHDGDVPRDQRTEPGDDREVNGGTTTPAAPAAPTTDDGGAAATTDDHGGDAPRDDRTESGDDRHGGDDRTGDDHGGHGGDD
ncbi:hypothetical protein [Microbacterium jejuense]|uniref:hypothetical protein n=1 Tax=Microbacterium jejuense TaxID=1263637 RepID=UPI0031E92E18